VGNLAAYKNVALLVRAFDRSGVAGALVLAGRPDEGFEDLRAEIDGLGARDRVRLLHGASDSELDALYRRSTALLHPSRYEGFGFTPLEAMLRGSPVAASDIPAIREVSGDGALLLPPGDEGAWAGAIRRLATDENLRRDLRGRGETVARRYSWDKTARHLCELFLRVGRARRES
jgi:glycosyltransferase involved in cell wall biosynthesis